MLGLSVCPRDSFRNGKRAARLVVLAPLLILLGCASAPQTKALLEDAETNNRTASYTIGQVPFFPQEIYQCGPAALATVLSHTGLAVTPESLSPDVYIPGREGSLQIELVGAARSRGRVVYELDGSIETLVEEVSAGNPVLVLQNLSIEAFPQWHFAVVKGYDLDEETLVLNSGPIEDYRLKLSTFERTWARADYWGITTLPPDSVPATAQPESYLQSLWDFEQTATDSRQVLDAYSAAVGRWPRNAAMVMALGNLQLANSNPGAAADHYSSVIELDPLYAPAHNNLAYAYAELRNFEQALFHANTAVELAGASGDYQESLHEITKLSRGR